MGLLLLFKGAPVIPPPPVLVAHCAVFTGTPTVGTPITPVAATASGGVAPYSFSATGLPSGLSMASNGTISGTPGVSGTFSYGTSVTDSTSTVATTTCSVTIQPAATPPLTVSCPVFTESLVQGQPITPVSATASGGTPPYTFSSPNMPPGLSINASGVVSGTPTGVGSYFYNVIVRDAVLQTSSTACSLTILPTPVGVQTTCLVIHGVVNQPITPQTMVATGGTAPYSFSATGLPPGLSLSGAGTLSGTPTTFGTFSYNVTVTDSTSASYTTTCSIPILPSPPAGTVGGLAGFIVIGPVLGGRVRWN